MKKTRESGRSLVETLSVLVVMAVLLLASVAGYHFLIHQYKKQQTVKQISELAVRYKVRPVHADDKKVAIKTIYPESDRSDAYTMNTADDGRVSLHVENSDAFSVVVSAILDDSCVSLLENGDYDAVLATNKYEPSEGNDYFAIGRKWLQDLDADTLTSEQKDALRDFLGSGVAITRENIINKICAGPTIGTAGLVFGGRCPKPGFSYWYSGKCWPCPKGQKEDRGKCCEKERLESKEYCYSCGCPTGTICDKDSGQCVECLEDTDCKGDKQYCDQESHVCVDCNKDEDCGTDSDGCPTHCVNHACSIGCDTSKSWWKMSGSVCDCTSHISLGEECSTTCGPDCCAVGLKCNDDNQCCPETLPEYGESCHENCGCATGLICGSSHKCECEEGSYWDPITRQCIICIEGCDGVCGSGKTDVGCGCGIAKTADGCCPGEVKDCLGVCGGTANDAGCGCGVAKTAEGCCPGQVKGCDGVCGSGKTDVGCGCGITKTTDGCCPGEVKGCDGVCGSGKADVGCGCGIAKTADGCCPGQVKGCDGVCGSGKADVGCGCGIAKTADGCCPGEVKGCDGVCGSGKTDVGCGCGITKTAEGCCPGEVKGCDGVCGSGKVDVGCGCGENCSKTPTCCNINHVYDGCPLPCQTCCRKSGDACYKKNSVSGTCSYGSGATGHRYNTKDKIDNKNGSRVCYNNGKYYGLQDCWTRTKKGDMYTYKNLRTKETKEKAIGTKVPPKAGSTCYLDPDKDWK